MGATFSDDDYPGLHSFEVTLIQVYRNSIGDIAPPEYKLWFNPEDNSYYETAYDFVMIKVIWLLWFTHQFFCMVMLLNFLISIISDYYSQISAFKNYYQYKHKSTLNWECLTFYNYHGRLSTFNMMIVLQDTEIEGADGNDAQALMRKHLTEQINKV